MSRRRKSALLTAEQLAIKVGDPVTVTLDNGIEMPTSARSDAFKAASGDWVIFLVGVSGFYALDRVQPGKAVAP